MEPRLCCSPEWHWRVTENPGGCSCQPEGTHGSWWMLIHAAAVAELAAHLGAVIQQDRTLPSPALVISGKSILGGSSRIPNLPCSVPGVLGPLCHRALCLLGLGTSQHQCSGVFGALVWGSGSRKSWAEQGPGLARVGFEVSWKKPGVVIVEGCTGLSWMCPLSCSASPVVPLLALPWSRASSIQCFLSPIDYLLAGPISCIALPKSEINAGIVNRPGDGGGRHTAPGLLVSGNVGAQWGSQWCHGMLSRMRVLSRCFPHSLTSCVCPRCCKPLDLAYLFTGKWALCFPRD